MSRSTWIMRFSVAPHRAISAAAIMAVALVAVRVDAQQGQAQEKKEADRVKPAAQPHLVPVARQGRTDLEAKAEPRREKGAAKAPESDCGKSGAANVREIKATASDCQKSRSAKSLVVAGPGAPNGRAGKWVCDEVSVNAAPVWFGEMVECTYHIRNEGQGPLNIQARGG